MSIQFGSLSVVLCLPCACSRVTEAWLLQGLGPTSGLTKLFTRIGNLAKGVIIGQAISIIWRTYPYASTAVRCALSGA